MTKRQRKKRPEVPAYDRVMAKVIKQEGDDACWIFDGALDQNGHGNVRVRGTKGKRAGKWTCDKAHRVVYMQDVGPIPPGHEVCHKCDTRACVRPTHLEAKPHYLNVMDMMERGRHGNQHYTAMADLGHDDDEVPF